MSDAILQLAYISRATAPLDDAALEKLAQVAALANADAAITGLLLHDGSRFIQALEGDAGAVDATMARIARDPRHASIAYIERAVVPARQFGDWAMDVRRVHDAQGTRAFLSDLKRTLRPVYNHRLVAAFIGFAMLGHPGLRARGAAPGSSDYA
jgi:hypothetical protein